MFLHIVSDEKFIDFAIDQFESVAKDQNRFVLINEQKCAEIKLIRNSQKVDPIILDTLGYKELLASAVSYKAVFVHFLCPLKVKFINDCPEQVRFVWMFWGQDAQKLFMDNSYLPITRKILKKMYGWNEYLWPYTNWVRRLYLPFAERGRAMHKIKFCAPVIKEELDLLNEKLNTNYKYIEFNYGSIESNFKGIEDGKLEGNDILIGNSSTLASNHLDAFWLLEDIELRERKIIVPLSYGDERYRDIIVKKGNEMFGNNFQPVIDFIPLQEYNIMLGSCRYIIMNHLRQQGLGNIQISLWRGAKVYMNDSNILYQSLKAQGYVIFSIQNDLREHLKLDEPLEDRVVMHNRKLLTQNYGEKAIADKMKKIVNFFSSQQN